MSSLRALALLATLSLVPSTAGADPEQPVSGVTYVFASVDAYTVGPATFDITGTLVGESTPRTFRFWPGSGESYSVEASRCDRLALLAMTRPGRYLFSWSHEIGYISPPQCTLTRQ
ncbi:hypothetical protein COCOR_06973 [Corallococcus coralloides DSM 2259]|uniref:Uncharacterized protein n=1 Tax=Corallococcus coralloides (strain ATCC 25202 / DSM 2259 / NBRC 100086 / M2) TaxID=1144275 RepID=H8N2H6_CORCM|nr:hypothetical protein [Corallococcus coralloides]AFE07249.1 hypothetical protein COCOR_06973 [Corallococcus coralloides DSM 2259]